MSVLESIKLYPGWYFLWLAFIWALWFFFWKDEGDGKA